MCEKCGEEMKMVKIVKKGYKTVITYKCPKCGNLEYEVTK